MAARGCVRGRRGPLGWAPAGRTRHAAPPAWGRHRGTHTRYNTHTHTHTQIPHGTRVFHGAQFEKHCIRPSLLGSLGADGALGDELVPWRPETPRGHPQPGGPAGSTSPRSCRMHKCHSTSGTLYRPREPPAPAEPRQGRRPVSGCAWRSALLLRHGDPVPCFAPDAAPAQGPALTRGPLLPPDEEAGAAAAAAAAGSAERPEAELG